MADTVQERRAWPSSCCPFGTKRSNKSTQVLQEFLQQIRWTVFRNKKTKTHKRITLNAFYLNKTIWTFPSTHTRTHTLKGIHSATAALYCIARRCIILYCKTICILCCNVDSGIHFCSWLQCIHISFASRICGILWFVRCTNTVLGPSEGDRRWSQCSVHQLQAEETSGMSCGQLIGMILTLSSLKSKFQ